MQLSHKIQLKPTCKQKQYCCQASGVSRHAWNWGVAEWEKQYLAHKQHHQSPKPNGLSLKKQFNVVKKIEYPWCYDVTKYASQQPFIFLQRAYSDFFKGIKGKPGFKKKGKCRDSFYIGGDQVQTRGHQIKIPKLGWVKMEEELRFNGKINSATVSRSADRWYVSFSVDVNFSPLACESQASVGIDLGINALATLSNGETFKGVKPLKKSLRQLKRAQRQLNRRKQKGSKNRYKQQMRVAKLHRRISHVRQDQLHKLTSTITRYFKYIAIEDLHIKGMMANRKLSRAISDMGFYEFKRQLLYKAEMRQCHVAIADRWYPSSKTCSRCGTIKKNLTLGERIFHCDCGLSLDRDLNAARNLEKAFCTDSSSGIHACGQDGSAFVYHAPTQPAWLKQEESPITA